MARPSLTGLNLGIDQIGNISPLADLTSLTRIDLGANQISNILPLVDNEGLSEDDEVYLQENPLSQQSTDEHIPELEARGVTVTYYKSESCLNTAEYLMVGLHNRVCCSIGHITLFCCLITQREFCILTTPRWIRTLNGKDSTLLRHRNAICDV